jgi:hypothetical protein
VASELQPTRRRKKRGYLNPHVVTQVSFWTTSACVLVAVVACILAIWKFTETDVLWRTVATCVVVGCGMVAFAGLNALFGNPTE